MEGHEMESRASSKIFRKVMGGCRLAGITVNEQSFKEGVTVMLHNISDLLSVLREKRFWSSTGLLNCCASTQTVDAHKKSGTK